MASFGELPAESYTECHYNGTAFIIAKVTTNPGRLFALEVYIRLLNAFWVQIWRNTKVLDENLNSTEYELISQWKYQPTKQGYQLVSFL